MANQSVNKSKLAAALAKNDIHINVNLVHVIEYELKKFGQKMAQAVEDDSRAAWLIMIWLAVINDLLDIAFAAADFVSFGIAGVIGQKPLDIATAIVLAAFVHTLKATGPFLQTRIKIIFWLLAPAIEFLFSFIPLIGQFTSTIPVWTIAILWVRHKVKKRAELAKEGLKHLEKGEIYEKAADEFIKN